MSTSDQERGFVERITFADEQIKVAAHAWNARYTEDAHRFGGRAFVAAMGEFIADQLAEIPGPDAAAKALLEKFIGALCDAYVEKRQAFNKTRTAARALDVPRNDLACGKHG